MSNLSRRSFIKATSMGAVGIGLMPISGFSKTKHRLRFADVQPASHYTNKAARWMAGELERRTNGQVTMEVYPGGALGGTDAVLTALSSGAVDMGWISSGQLARTFQKFNIFGVSYLIRDNEHYKRVASPSSPVFERMAEIIRGGHLGLEMTGIMGGPARCLYNAVRPVKVPSDLEGLRIRIQNSPIQAKIWAALGAEPTPLAWTEVYTGLQSGVIDGAESSIAAYFDNKFFEIADNLSLTNHQYTVLPVLASKRTLESLPVDLRDLVIQLSHEASKKCWEIGWSAVNELVTETLPKRNVTIVNPDISLFQDKVEDIASEAAKEYKAGKLLKLINEVA